MRPELVGDALAWLARVISGASLRNSPGAGAPEEKADPSLPGNRCEQRVYVANHSSHLDFIVLWSALPVELRRVTRPVAAKDYWEKTALRRYLALKVYRAILIEREHVAAHNNPIELIATEMGDRYSVIVFPEGTRGDGEEVGAFKSGVYHLLNRKPGLKCVPVYIENLNRVLPKGEFLPLPILSSITIGQTLAPEESESKHDFLRRLRNAVLALRDDELN